MTPNGEAERPRTGASRAARAQSSEARSRRATTGVSRTAPAMVSGQRGSFAPALRCPPVHVNYWNHHKPFVLSTLSVLLGGSARNRMGRRQSVHGASAHFRPKRPPSY